MLDRFFLCIGAQKASTTWLYETLRHHQDVYLPPLKELHYFNSACEGHSLPLNERRELIDNQIRGRGQDTGYVPTTADQVWFKTYCAGEISDDWYMGLFADRGEASAPGEMTPNYATLPVQGFRHIQSLAPNVRLIYILRDPVERAWSQLFHKIRAGRQALDPGEETGDLETFFSRRDVMMHSNYAAVLERLSQVFTQDQLLVLFHEELHQDRRAALEQICAHLSVSMAGFSSEISGKAVHKTDKQLMPAGLKQRVIELYRPSVQALVERHGRIPETWKKRYQIG